MKILHVVSGVFKHSGGTSEVVPRMCEALKDAGQDVHLLTLDWGPIADAATRAIEKGVLVEQCPRDRVPIFKGLGLSRTFSQRIVEEVRWADVIHLHGLWQWPCWRAASEAQRQGKPYVMQTHGFLEPERLKKSSLKKKIIGSLLERPRINAAVKIIATAESEKKGIADWGARPEVEIVPIGIDTRDMDNACRDVDWIWRFIDARDPKRMGVGLRGVSSPNKKILLYFSRLAPIKGLDLLANAWAQLKAYHRDWHLLLVGPDDRGYAGEIRTLYEKLCPDGTWSILEPVFGADKFTLLKSVDAFVLPTRSENFSIAVQEALAAGLPVVCTKGAPWSGLEGRTGLWGRCGYWVDVNPREIQEGLQKLLGQNDEQRGKMGEEGRKFIHSTFSWSSVVENLVAIYQTMII